MVFHAITFAGSRGRCLNTRPLGRVFKYLPSLRCSNIFWSESSLCLSGKERTQAFFMQTAKTRIRPGECPDWSESSLGAYIILLVLSCTDTYEYLSLLLWDQFCLKKASMAAFTVNFQQFSYYLLQTAWLDRLFGWRIHQLFDVVFLEAIQVTGQTFC